MKQVDYSFYEQVLMMIFTSLSNFWSIPGSIGLYRHQRYYQFFLNVFVLFSSTMYHILDSFKIENFLFDSGHWHKLDNIAAIQGFISQLVLFLDVKNNEQEELYNLIGFLLTLICQEGYPWNVYFTLIPVSPYIFLLIKKLFSKGYRQQNKIAKSKGLRYLIIGFIFFFLGLDETKDYLRIFHSLWHCFCNFSMFYLFQLYFEDDKEIYYLDIIFPNKKLKFI